MARNQDRIRERARERWATDPAYREHRRTICRRSRLKAVFGMSLEEYDALLAQQGGVCAICKQPETEIWRGGLQPLSVDHDHVTNEVRGLLCDRCNRGIGALHDSPALLAAAIAYLTRAN